LITLDRLKDMLKSPKVKENIPDKFNENDEEALYLYDLINDCLPLKEYEFLEFIAPGGTGMVFKIKRNPQESFCTALKIVRKKYYNMDPSPFTQDELDASKELVHANILRQYDFIPKEGKKIIAICSALIDNPQSMDKSVKTILEKSKPKMDPYFQISSERLNDACKKIVVWFHQVALALQYMHENNFYHMDIKPANILLYGTSINIKPIITDLGSCINLNKEEKTKRAHFTWAYAHPELTDIGNKPGSVEGGGLKASAEIKDYSRLPIYDLYALAMTMKQILAVIVIHFGEMSFSNYSFRYLHTISALLLDGQNSIEYRKKRSKILERHRIQFVDDYPMGINKNVFDKKKIRSAKDLVERLKRHSQDYSISALAEEFGHRNSRIVNNTVGGMVPFSKRVAEIFNHPILKRLYDELQLGIITDVYPGASHNRWSHSVGVYSLTLKYYISLLSDSENPFLKIVINKTDIEHAILAAIFHDLGHTAFCHDMEAVDKNIFNHVSFIENLVNESLFTSGTLKEMIVVDSSPWEKIDFDRVYSIISGKPDKEETFDIIDYVASDIINGPIDADKLDYIKRDSYYCGVPYGEGIDYDRIINSLTIKEKDSKIRLAYYAKGRTAISSMLIARNQLYGAVYWHHTYRCLHAMIFYATQIAIKNITDGFSINKKINLEKDAFKKLYYYRSICKYPWPMCWEKALGEKDIGKKGIFIKGDLKEESDLFTRDRNYALDFIYKFTNDHGKMLLENVVKRNLFKRIYSKKLSGNQISKLITDYTDRIQISMDIQRKLVEVAKNEQLQSQLSDTDGELIVRKDLKNLWDNPDIDLNILVDFPRDVTISSSNWPDEVGDSSRKFQNNGRDDSIEILLNSTNAMLNETACLRIYAEPKYFNIITRYLDPESIERCIKNVILVL
jgi:HD superfamily phosphohydrolase